MEIRLLSVKELLDMMSSDNKLYLVDVRDNKTYGINHIADAVNIPEDEFEDINEPYHPLVCCFRRYEAAGYLIVLYCDRGNASMLCAAVLVRNGIACASLVGGLTAYDTYTG